MKDFKELVKDVERELVISLSLNMRHKRLNKKDARDLAREFMSDSPFQNEEQLFKKLHLLSDKYRVVRRVYIKYASEYEANKDERMIKLMRNYMKEKQFENAIRVAKGGE